MLYETYHTLLMFNKLHVYLAAIINYIYTTKITLCVFKLFSK